MFSPAPQTGSLRAAVEDRIATAIIAGALPAGELVSVPVLASEFAVSATPVREAMLNLEKIGFVEPVRNKGFRVTEVSMRDLEEIVELRRLLEVPAVERIARECASEIVDSAAVEDLQSYVAADIAFHRELLSLAGNERLVEMTTSLRRQTRLSGLSDMRGRPELAASAREHLELLDLVRAGDAEGAGQLMRRHVAHVLGWWSGRPEDDAAE